VLLLVVQSRHDQIDDVLICRLEQPCHRGVHVGAVRRDGVNARPTEHATRRPRITRPYRFVVGIEEEAKRLIERRDSLGVGTSTNVSKTTLCAPDATWSGWHPAWIGPSDSSAESGSARPLSGSEHPGSVSRGRCLDNRFQAHLNAHRRVVSDCCSVLVAHTCSFR